MTERIDIVYDRLIAEEKLKAGTKYERLAAVAFRILTERATVHDLRLHGGVGVPHQIDVVVGDDHKRILIEAKDYDRSVDLPIVRDFSAVVEDLRPDDAVVVTTAGFSDSAQKWAEAKGITLALLRPPKGDDDWANLARSVGLTMKMSAPADPRVEWCVDPSEAERFDGDRNPIGRCLMDDIRVSSKEGERIPFRSLIRPQLEAKYGALPPGKAGELEGEYEFDKPTWLYVGDQEPVRVTGYRWTQKVAVATHSFSVGYGIGGLAAELVLRALDGSLHRIFTNKQIQSWTFDGKHVVPRR